ncbi:MAG: hypothetical protein PHF79_01600 [Candidatus Pacebacteria bacterium]|nr:hypothetical protein [Candidatus Paceibacterota bacterium]
MQTNEITIAYRDWYVDAWQSIGLGNNKRLGNSGDEVDLGLGWSHSYDYVKLSVQMSYFILSQFRTAADDRPVFDVRADFLKVPVVQPYVAARWMGRFTQTVKEGGWFYWLGARRVQPLGFSIIKGSGQVKFNLDASIVFSDGALERTGGLVYGRMCGTLDIPLSKNLSLMPSIIWQIPSSTQRGTSISKCYDSHQEIAYSLGMQLKF